MNLYPTGPFAEEARRLNSRTTGLAPVTTFYLLVGGSSTVRDQADVVARRLRAKGYQPEVFSENQAGSTVYRVRVGSYETNRAAVLKAAQLRAAGFDVEVRP
jgi:cell division protein FtsN